MRDGGRALELVAICLCLVLLTPTTAAAGLSLGPSPGQVSSTGASYPNTSWALGIVVPEGAALQGGASLRWEGVTNVTAVFTLPNITMPDRRVYAVLSVMTEDGSILQAAAGIRPNESIWLAYSWSIPNLGSVPLIYHWILNASMPVMAPGSRIRVSIFHLTDGWNLRVVNECTGTSVERAFPSGPSSTLKAGDQELFSLESYSRSWSTFRGSGNLTLTGLLVEGTKIIGGTYSYSEWDPSRSPLFVVGSSGASPPSFVQFEQSKNSSFVWGFGNGWVSSGSPFASIAEGFALLSLVFLSALALILLKTRNPNAASHR